MKGTVTQKLKEVGRQAALLIQKLKEVGRQAALLIQKLKDVGADVSVRPHFEGIA